ncbi:unnamed protein product [Rhizophagus irregularis]|nr:unnamed protein product [Rhizophagus irregularis]CAB5200533.1 unnamed protein product [Rhizophagus irregularis]
MMCRVKFIERNWLQSKHFKEIDSDLDTEILIENWLRSWYCKTSKWKNKERSSSVVANKKYRIAEIGFFGCVLWFIGRGILHRRRSEMICICEVYIFSIPFNVYYRYNILHQFTFTIRFRIEHSTISL